MIRETKRIARKMRNSIKNAEPTTLAQFHDVLTKELGLQAGDKIFVSSSFGNLYAKDYSPQEAISTMMEIVGPDGLIMMPYYPPINSMEWVRSGEVFDMNQTQSGMGVMTNVFSQMEGVVKSEHPFKAVCVWGKDAERYASGHYLSEDPYGEQTPYGRLLMAPQSKSLSLGLVNLPMFHAIEDIYQDPISLYFDDKPYDVPLKLADGEMVSCHTLVHSPSKCEDTIMGGEFVKRFSSPIRKVAPFGYNNLYMIDNNLLVDAVKKEFALGKTRKKK